MSIEAKSDFKKKITVKISHFPIAFTTQSFIDDYLSDLDYQFEPVEKDPDILIYSNFFKPNRLFPRILFQLKVIYQKHLKGKGRFLIPKVKEGKTRVFYTYESCKIYMSKLHYAVGFDYEEDVQSENYRRMDNYYSESKINLQSLVAPKPPPEVIAKEQQRFCNFVYSNDNTPVRKRFFKKLSRYKRVDSPAKSMKNMENIGRRPDDKIAFQRHYKFSIAFENSSTAGYTTEKIIEPMLANSIPIYWGNPQISRHYNTKSFINYYDIEKKIKQYFPSFLFKIPILRSITSRLLTEITLNALVKKVIEVDQSKDLYEAMLREPWFASDDQAKAINSTPIRDMVRKAIEDNF